MALLPDRKLVSFEDQPLSAVPSGKEGLRCLLYYHFEDQLKKRCAHRNAHLCVTFCVLQLVLVTEQSSGEQ